MKIFKVDKDKEKYMDLLLEADEQEDMVMKYLYKGDMYVLEDNDSIVAECIVTEEKSEILEIKNIAVVTETRGKGYGKKLIDFIEGEYRDKYSFLQVGTGDSPLTVPFYEKCGFTRHHSIKNFFLDNYDHEIWEAGVKLVDMVYLMKRL